LHSIQWKQAGGAHSITRSFHLSLSLPASKNLLSTYVLPAISLQNRKLNSILDYFSGFFLLERNPASNAWVFFNEY